jgi:hypothetical protein
MGPSPIDRARTGSKHHLLVDATGIPLAWTVTGGDRNVFTPTNTGASFADAASAQRSRDLRPCTAPASAAPAGSWSAPSPGWHNFKRLLVRYDSRHEVHQAFLALGCCLVRFRRLQNSL